MSSIFGKGQVTPQNIVLTGQNDFFYRLVREYVLGSGVQIDATE